MSSTSDIADVAGSTTEAASCPHSLDTLPIDEFLRVVGLRVRAQRSTLSMSRKRLAEVSGVSERYLAQLESGQGNMSIALLRKVTCAIGMSLGALLSAEVPEVVENIDNHHTGIEPNGLNVSAAAHAPVEISHEQRINAECSTGNPHRVPELQ